ncbi:MAG: hypothetical protein BGO34_22130 [Bacteroidia bacterium 44-10]|nr:MAG: hypothetical protein BGO34_22130 [Bacteroidia bacterium 44-10]
MGTIKQGILGGFSGKVGTVVGGTWKGIHYMRSLPSSVRNPRTPGQVKQRTKFSIMIEFLKPLTPFLRIGFKTYADRKTAFNAAMSYNVNNAVEGEYPDLELDFSKILVSRGSLLPAENTIAIASEGNLNFTWNDNSGISSASAKDLAMPLIFNKDKGESVFSTEAGERSAGSATMNIPDSWMGDTVEIYLGFISEDGTQVANSIYLGQQTIA